MKDYNSNKNKHLTLAERIEIQSCLDKQMTFKAIGKHIEKDQTTVSKEIKKHLELRDSMVFKDKAGKPIF